MSKKKYGGLAPKKKPLISKDHERAFFDSADWALCKQGAGVNQKSTVAIETLRPKLQVIIITPLLLACGFFLSCDRENSISHLLPRSKQKKKKGHEKGVCDT
ncbi:hypothetical protein OIU84_019324 [Salix udensis]|uniref:Uncharacterized protein n=1 Tax=Salix udensis TaxID=889485 RepID=A0AAD6PJH0_9ROSI|nr:hypothetical protein OIU84_019324 [Salix udensis]